MPAVCLADSRRTVHIEIRQLRLVSPLVVLEARKSITRSSQQSGSAHRIIGLVGNWIVVTVVFILCGGVSGSVVHWVSVHIERGLSRFPALSVVHNLLAISVVWPWNRLGIP